jgi:hypothetical protein
MNCLNENDTISSEKIRSIQPKIMNTAEGTKYEGRNFPKRCHPAGIRASPAKTERIGHHSLIIMGIILSAERKRKKPTSRKKAAKKRYVERLLSFTAKNAHPEPVITKKNELNMDILDVLARLSRRKAQPRNINKRPKIKISRAVICFILMWRITIIISL